MQPLDVKLQDFDGLKNFVRAVYQYEGARETMDWDRVKPYQVVSFQHSTNLNCMNTLKDVSNKNTGQLISFPSDTLTQLCARTQCPVARSTRLQVCTRRNKKSRDPRKDKGKMKPFMGMGAWW